MKITLKSAINEMLIVFGIIFVVGIGVSFFTDFFTNMLNNKWALAFLTTFGTALVLKNVLDKN